MKAADLHFTPHVTPKEEASSQMLCKSAWSKFQPQYHLSKLAAKTVMNFA